MHFSIDPSYPRTLLCGHQDWGSSPDSQAEGGAASKQESAETSASEEVSEPGHRFIDYQPPRLTTPFDKAEQSRLETPMQPTVEFPTESSAPSEASVRQPRRPIEEEWDIEEVAFKPRGLDNSDPSKSSK